MPLAALGFSLGLPWRGRCNKRWGYGATIIWGACMSDAAFLLTPLAPHQLVIGIPLLIAAQFCANLAGPITAITQLSLRQAIVPAEVLGRINGTLRFVVAALTPLSALLGRVLASQIGLWQTIVFAAVGMQLGFVRLLFSPLRGQRTLPSSLVAPS